ETVGIVPDPLAVHGPTDGGEVLQELQDQVNSGPFACLPQDGSNGAHGEGVSSHPPRGIGLLQDAADRQVRAVERPDVVQSKKAALEEVVSAGVLPVDPPGEVDQQLVEDPAEEVDVATAVDGEDLERRKGLDRRIDVAEVPLVGG